MGGDRALRPRCRLGEEEPVVPALGELGIAARQRLADRDDVEDDQRRHGVGLVQREPHRDVAAAVVPDHREARVAELVHEGDAVARHRPLRIGLVIVGRQRLRRLAVAAQVGADHRVGGRQEGDTRCHVVCVRGCPCSSSTGGPDPPWRTRKTASPTSISSRAKPSNIHCSVSSGAVPKRARGAQGKRSLTVAPWRASRAATSERWQAVASRSTQNRQIGPPLPSSARKPAASKSLRHSAV